MVILFFEKQSYVEDAEKGNNDAIGLWSRGE
jgi:hypothetical protein